MKVFYRIISILLLMAITATNVVFADSTAVYIVETSYISFNRAGHIYPINEKIVFSLTEKNTSNSTVNITYEYGYTSTDNSSFFEKEISFAANEEKKIVFELENPNTYGIYKLKISKTEEVNGITAEGQIVEDEFSVCVYVQSGDENSDYGMSQHVVEHNIGRVDTTNLFVKNAGIKIVRDGYRWQSVEKEKGVLVFDPAIKEKFSAMHEEGLKILFICGYGNSLYTGGNMTAPATEEAIAGYARYCAFLAKELKGIVDYFEIWNEYNYTSFNVTNETPENYAKILKAAYTAIKEVNPEATVLGLSMGGVYPKWVQRVFAAGGYDYMDAVSLHPYEYTNVFDEVKLINSINSIKDIMRTYEKGDSIKPVWYTEIGFSTYNGDTGFSEEHQAKNTVLSYAVSKAYDLADKYIQYTVYDIDNIANQESCWGILRAPKSAQYVPEGAKPCYLAVAAMNSFIGGNTEYKGVVTNGRYYAFNFYNSRRNKNVMLIQSYQGEKTIKYNLGCNTVDVYDMYGNKMKRLYSDNGIYEFCIGEMPQYVMGKFSSFVETSSESDAIQIPYSEVNTNQNGEGNVGSYNITITDNASNPIENAKLKLYCGRLFVTLPDSVPLENIDGINIKAETEEFTPADSVDIVIYNTNDGENRAYATGVTDEEGKEYIPFECTELICNECLDRYTSVDEMYQNGWQTGEWGSMATLANENSKCYAELSKAKTGKDISLKYTLLHTEERGSIRITSRVRFSSDASGVIEVIPNALTANSNGVLEPLGANLLTFTKGQFQTLLTGNRKVLSFDPSEWYDITVNLNLNSKTFDIQISSGGNVVGAHRDVPLEIQDYTKVLGTVDSLSSVRFRCWNGKTDVAALKIERVLNDAQSMVMTSENFDGVTYDNAKNHGLGNPFGVLDEEIASFVKPDNRSSKVVQLNGDKHIRKEFTAVSKGRYRLSYTVLSGNGRFFVEVNDDGDCNGNGGLLLPYAEKGKLYYTDSTTNTVKILGSAKVGVYVTFECILDFDNKKTTFSAWETDTGRRLGGEVTVDGLNENKGKELSALKYLHILKWYDSYPGYFDDLKLEYIGGESTVPTYNVTFVDYKGNEIENTENINSALQKVIVDTDDGIAADSLIESVSLSKVDGLEYVNVECSIDELNRIVLIPKTMLETNTEYILTVPNRMTDKNGGQDGNFEFRFKTGAVLQNVVNENLDKYSAIDKMYQNGWQTGEWGNTAILSNENGKSYAELSETKTGNTISLKYSLPHPEDSGCVRVESRVRFGSDASGVIEFVPDTLTANSSGVMEPLGTTLLTYSRGTMQTQLMGGRKFFNYIPNEWYYITAMLNFDTKSYDMQITNNGNVIGAYRGIPLEIQDYTKVLGTVDNLAHIRYRCWGGELDVGDLKIERVLKGSPSLTVSSENFNDVTFDTAKNHGIFAPYGDTLDSLISFDKPNDYSSVVLNFNAYDKHIIKEFTPISNERYRISYKEKITGQRMFAELRKNSINDNSKLDNGNIILPYSGVNGNLYYYDNDLKEGKKFGVAAMNSWVEFICDIDFGAGTITYSAKNASNNTAIGGTVTKPLLDTNGDMLDMARCFHLSSWGGATLYLDDFKVEYVSEVSLSNPAKWVVGLENAVTEGGKTSKNIADLTAGESITVNTEILNTEDSDKELLWFTAYYKNGICKAVDSRKDLVLAGVGTLRSQNFTLPSDIRDIDTVKIMLWNNTDKMSSYCEPLVIK